MTTGCLTTVQTSAMVDFEGQEFGANVQSLIHGRSGLGAGLSQHPSNYTPGKRPDNRVAGRRAGAVLSDGSWPGVRAGLSAPAISPLMD